MGIRLLNKFLNKKCNYNKNYDNDCIRKTHLSKLRNKKICVDINVYLYDYLCQDKLKINMLSMCNVFNQYNIVPLFVFDGKPPQIKKDEIERRRNERIINKKKYSELLKTPEKIEKLSKQQLYDIKRSFLRMTGKDIEMVKNIITSYGMKYIIADGEADPLCSKLVNDGIVYACMTQDMDQMVYKTNTVFRDFDIDNHTVVVYKYKNIINKLRINTFDFTVLCIISGCDYINKDKMDNRRSNIFYHYNLYLKYKKYQKKIKSGKKGEYHKRLKSYKSFLSWLIDKKIVDYNYKSEEYKKICTIIEVYKNEINIDITNNDIVFGKINISNLYKIIFEDNIWKGTNMMI